MITRKCLKCHRQFLASEFDQVHICKKCIKVVSHEGGYVQVAQGTWILAKGRSIEKILSDLSEKGYKELHGASCGEFKVSIEEANSISHADH